VKAALFMCSLLVNLMMVRSAYVLVMAAAHEEVGSFWVSFLFALYTAYMVGRHWAESANHDCTMARLRAEIDECERLLAADPTPALPSDP
jgi:hypothetical protein